MTTKPRSEVERFADFLRNYDSTLPEYNASFLTTADAAEILDRSKRTIRKWAGVKFPCFKMGSRTVIPFGGLGRFLAENYRGGEDPYMAAARILLGRTVVTPDGIIPRKNKAYV